MLSPLFPEVVGRISQEGSFLPCATLTHYLVDLKLDLCDIFLYTSISVEATREIQNCCPDVTVIHVAAVNFNTSMATKIWILFISKGIAVGLHPSSPSTKKSK